MKFSGLSLSKDFIQFLKYQVERFLIRGPFYQVLFIGLIIGLISVIAGQILLFIEPTEGGLGSSAWWAFLRMSDPGYLGDDNGVAKRVLATVLTLLGYVLFMGSLVAIMTQWLYRKMKELESGYTPILIKGHVSILGYTNRTPIIIQEILASKERFKRFLLTNKKASRKIVVLNDKVGFELIADLKEHIKNKRELQKVVFRTGDLMRAEDLTRINIEHSSVVIIPSMIYGENGHENSDTKAIKALLSIKSRADIAKLPSPKVVVEILDQNNVDVARAAYGENIQIISGRVLLARMIAQSIQNPGLSYVITELIAQSEGSEIYLKVYEELVGKSWGEVKDAFPNCIAIGLVSNFQRDRCVVNPKNSETLLEGDLIIFIATTFDSINLDRNLLKKNEGITENEILKDVIKKPKKLLIMGWSMKAPFLIKELYETQKYEFKVDILSQVDVCIREKALLSVMDQEDYSAIRHFVADYTSFNDISDIEFSQYDNVVFLSSDRTNDATDADARSILGILQLRQVIGVDKEFPVVIELAEPENEKLFENRQGETIISPMVISYILSNVALRFELNRVFDSLFNAGGSDITFISAKHFGLSGSLTFEEISNIVYSFNMIAIGVKKNDQNEIFLNPNSGNSFSDLENYKIIVIN